MKSVFLLICWFGLCGITIANDVTGNDTARERARSITRKVRYHTSGFGSLTARLRMTLENRRGYTSERLLRFELLETDTGGMLGLCVVDGPPDVRGTALLTHNHADGNMDQWIYMPALRRTRRIASRGRSGTFMGSEFTYEDLSGGFGLEHTTALWLRDEQYNNRPCHVVEYIPADLSVTDYARRILWVDRDDFRIHKVDYYNRRNELLKSLELTGHRLFQQRFWHATAMEMANRITGNRSRVEWQDIEVGADLNPEDFERHRLQHLR